MFARIDHRILTNKNSEHATHRVLRQRIPLEEYRVALRFIQGTKNEPIDMLSRKDFVHELDIHIIEISLQSITKCFCTSTGRQKIGRTHNKSKLKASYGKAKVGRYFLRTNYHTVIINT